MDPGNANAALYAPLPKAPTAVSLTVRKLIAQVQAGTLRVPSFQRPLRWKAEDVVLLFDSILRGYPIGSLLLCRRAFGADEQLRVGSARLQVPACEDGWFIVDGQQRVTALAASLLDLDQAGDPRWHIRFDPVWGEFLAGAASLDVVRRHVPLRVLGDLRRLGRWFPDCDLSEAEKTRVEEVQQRILDYEVPACVVETDDADALRGVFARLNTTGVRMRADEVFQPLLGRDAGSPAGRRGVDLGALQAAADVDGFGAPSRSLILSALFSMSGLDARQRLEEVGPEALSRLVSEEDAAAAIRRAVDFLAAPVDAAEPGAGIPAGALVPYPSVLQVLARWFHVFPESDDTTRRALAQWFWRHVVTGGRVRTGIAAMVRHDPAGSLERLSAAVGEPFTSEWSLGPFHANRAETRVEVLALLERGPRDLDGPVSWRALLSGGPLGREVFRASRFEDRALRKQAHTAANRVLLDIPRSEMQAELGRWEWRRHREALESHLIDEEGLADLGRRDAAHFLSRRAARLRVLVSGFVARRAGIGAPRLLPVEAYYDTENGGDERPTTVEHAP